MKKKITIILCLLFILNNVLVLVMTNKVLTTVNKFSGENTIETENTAKVISKSLIYLNKAEDIFQMVSDNTEMTYERRKSLYKEYKDARVQLEKIKATTNTINYNTSTLFTPFIDRVKIVKILIILNLLLSVAGLLLFFPVKK
jgi:hypothetical protein